MKKYFIFGDVHSFFTEWQTALKEAHFDIENEDHILVSLGDLFDRGPDSKKCLDFIMSLPKERRILIRGNHEDLMEDLMNRGEFGYHDWHNGTVQTVADLSMDTCDTTESAMIFGLRKNKKFMQYLSECVDYAEIGNAIFVHGWIPCFSNDNNKYHSKNVTYSYDENWRNGDWDTARWINGMKAWSDGVRVPGCIVYMGHWHTSYAHCHIRHTIDSEFGNPRSTNPEHRKTDLSMFIDDGIVALDGCVPVSHHVNIYVLER